MPSEATSNDIVNFVLRIASVKIEHHKVTPLVKALATAARVLDGRIVAPTTLLPIVLALYLRPAPDPCVVLWLLGLSQTLLWRDII